MRARVPAAVAALVLAATCLAGCRTNAGVAARVGDHSISESTVDSYITRGAVPANQSSSGQNGSQLVVQFLILRDIYGTGASEIGAAPSAGELAAKRSQLTNDQGQLLTDAEFDSELANYGVKASLTPVIVAAEEYQLYFGDLSTTDKTRLTAAFKRLASKVYVSPRYGGWDAAKTQVGGGAAPDYLKLQPTATADSGLSG